MNTKDPLTFAYAVMYIIESGEEASNVAKELSNIDLKLANMPSYTCIKSEEALKVVKELFDIKLRGRERDLVDPHTYIHTYMQSGEELPQVAKELFSIKFHTQEQDLFGARYNFQMEDGKSAQQFFCKYSSRHMFV